jgi:RNA polymerase sigma factor (sigma-70 family)
MSEAAAAAGFSRLLSDERLTKRAISGDEKAFAAIFRRYHQSLYRFCLAIVGNPEDAQDALQNMMIKVLRALPGEDREIELKPWLYRIAHNESIDLLRRRRETRALDAEQPAPGYGLAEDAATRERLRRLITDLRNLPERQRDVLVMRELAGLDFDEIATALSTSGAVARQTLYEARQSLRQMEEGREMNCETVMKALSDGDGRVTRRRDVRAHLRSCAACSSFGDEIKSRQQEFAALSPLPAIAAAGMLQGLVGGSSAATGGGLAALFGGGAAQGIGASVAAKGVATVAVAAAVGVTAADRTGLIHVGLPGGGEAKTSEPTPGSHSHQRDHHYGGSQAGVGEAGAAGGKGSTQPGTKGQGAGANAGAAEGTAADRASRAGVEAGSKGYGPGVQHPSGREHEKQHPPAASVGQETAAGKKPPLPEQPPAAGGEPPVPVKPPKATPEAPAKPPKTAPETGSAPKDAPTSAPAPTAPEPPQQAKPPSAPAQSQAPVAAPAPPPAPEESQRAGKGKGKGA